MSKSSAIDKNVNYFYYEADLKIEPPLADNKAKSASSDFFDLVTHKDEDVQIVNGQLTVVAEEVTKIKSRQDPDDHNGNYSGFKAAINVIAQAAGSAGSKLNGSVLVKDTEDGAGIFRIRVTDNTIVVEAGRVAVIWPDGTTSPVHKGW